MSGLFSSCLSNPEGYVMVKIPVVPKTRQKMSLRADATLSGIWSRTQH